MFQPDAVPVDGSWFGLQGSFSPVCSVVKTELRRPVRDRRNPACGAMGQFRKEPGRAVPSGAEEFPQCVATHLFCMANMGIYGVVTVVHGGGSFPGVSPLREGTVLT